MGFSFNKIQIGGNLTRDIEIKHTDSGLAIANLGIAVNERKKEGTEWVDGVIFFDVTLFGKLAERCNEHLVKGNSVLIDGRLQLDNWEDKDGNKRSKLKVVGNDVTFVPPWGRKDKQGSGNGGPGSDDVPF